MEIQRATPIVVATIGILVILSTALWAGGTGFDDDHEHSEDQGPPIFGFVKDTRGAAVPDARVSAKAQSAGSVLAETITRTNILGAYRFPGFHKEVSPAAIQVLCEKEGYKYVRTMRRMAMGSNPNTPIEIECILQRI
jgi:hypothetical protein